MTEEKDLRDFLSGGKDGTFRSGSTLEGNAPLSAQDEIVAALKKVKDPEIPVDIYELGLIYRINQMEEGDARGDVEIDMTLTNPACPVAGELPQSVADSVSSLVGVGRVKVNLVWDPPWSKNSLSPRARAILSDVL